MQYTTRTLLFLCPALAIWIAAIARGWDGSGYGGAKIAGTWTGWVLVFAYLFLVATGKWRYAIRAGCVVLSVAIASNGWHKEERHHVFQGATVHHQRRFARLQHFIDTHPEYHWVTAVDQPWQKRYSRLSGMVENVDDLGRLEQFIKTLPRTHRVFNSVTVRMQ